MPTADDVTAALAALDRAEEYVSRLTRSGATMGVPHIPLSADLLAVRRFVEEAATVSAPA